MTTLTNPPEVVFLHDHQIICPVHRHVGLTNDEYRRQMLRPDDRWTCPECGMISHFDDTYECMRQHGCKECLEDKCDVP